MMVLDASAALELLLGRPAAARVWARVTEPNQTLHAPHLIDLEIAQVLRRFAAARELDEARAEQVFADLRALGIERYPHEPLLVRVWQLKANLSAYDAAYVALAEALGAPLLTLDHKLARARGHRARVECVA